VSATLDKDLAIDGRMSRQDTSTLRQIAARLGGIYRQQRQAHQHRDPGR
jgi:hypothetical protein